MRALVHRAVRDPIVQAWAKEVAAGATPMEQVRALDTWLRTHFVFRDDPRKVHGIVLEDFLIDPRVAVARDRAGQLVEGDCDDAAMLVATVGLAVGLRATFRAVGFDGSFGPLSHVFTVLHWDGQGVRVDTTRPWGVSLPSVTRILEREV